MFKPHQPKGAIEPTQTQLLNRSAINQLYYIEYTTMSAFDPKQLLAATTTEASTRRQPIPPGTVLIGTLGAPDTRQVEGKKETNRGTIYTFLEIPVTFDMNQVPDIKARLELPDTVTLRWSSSLDISPSGGLDMSPGKNNGLRFLREALGMNSPGQPFSIQMVEGRPIRCVITNEPITAGALQGEMRDAIGSIAKV